MHCKGNMYHLWCRDMVSNLASGKKNASCTVKHGKIDVRWYTEGPGQKQNHQKQNNPK